MRKRWVIGGVVVVAAVAAGVALMAGRGAGFGPLSPAQAKSADPPKPPLDFLPTEVVQPQRLSLPKVVSFSGPLVAPDTAVVRAKAAGVLTALSAEEGQHVRAGQMLARIDQAELASRVAERQAQVAAAQAAVAQAERTHASNERLAAQSFISPVALDNSRAALDAARAQARAAAASLDTTRVGQRDSAVVAPIAGVVAKRQVVAGEKVSLEQPLLTIVDLARLELAGTVGTHEVAQLAPGMPVSLRIEGLDGTVAGTLARIAPAAEPGTRAIGVTVSLPNPGQRLRGGLYAVAQVSLRDEATRLTLPVGAVAQTGGQDHVWALENGALARRVVTLGRRDEARGRVEVLTGLDERAQVLAMRFDNLREGAAARIVTQRSAAVASAPASAAPVR